MKNYRTAFAVALAVNLALLAALGVVWWRTRAAARAEPTGAASPVAASSTAPAASLSASPPAPATPASTPLAPIQLTPQRLQQIGVTFGPVREQAISTHVRTTGNVAIDERRVSSVQLRFAGWIQQVFVNSTFQHVRQGQPLFTIYSPELVTTEREYLLARRNEQLLGGSPVPGVSRGASSLLDAARARLEQWTIPAREIARLEKTGKPEQNVEIDSPATGYVTEWHALPQTYVQPQTALYTIADLSSVWVYANVFQNDIAQIRVGSHATVTVDSYPGRTFRGLVDDIWPQVDEATRTVKVRLVFPNPGVKLMPGMFVSVDITAPLGRQTVVPASAIFHTGTRALVFVDHGGGYLEPRDVETGPRAGDDVVVLRGVQAGERVVTSANFLIDSESQIQAALGSFVPPPPGAGAAAAMNQPAAAKATLALSTAPSPPQKGQNTLHVTLRDAAGKPVSGAEIQVTFFMPAMPAMGMAAMRAQATLHETAPGVYEGPIQLASGGTWQVTITARRNGAVIATQNTTVSATGGM